jgi:hypothetical protein
MRRGPEDRRRLQEDRKRRLEQKRDEQQHRAYSRLRMLRAVNLLPQPKNGRYTVNMEEINRLGDLANAERM